MASGAEILSYKGQAELALGSSDLPASSSVYVSDFDKSFQFWQNYAQRKFIADKAKWDQNNLERAANQKRLEDALNLGNYDIWDVDKDEFMKDYYDPIRELVRKNPTASDPNNPDYMKLNDLVGRAKQAASFSTQQKADYQTTSKFRDANPDSILNIDAPEKYRDAGGIMERANAGISLQPKFDINPYADQDKLIKLIQYDNPNLEVTTGKYGNDLYTITQNPKLDKAREAIQAEYKGNINNQRAIQQMINDDPSIMDSFESPQDLYESIRISALPLDEKTKIELRSRYVPPQDPLTKPKLRVDYSTDNVTVAGTSRAGKGGYITVKIKTTEPDGTITETFNVKDKDGNVVRNFSTQLEADKFRAAGKMESAQAIGGWDISKSGNAPSNILIRTPTEAYDLTDNRKLSTEDLTTANAWNVDVIGVYDFYTDPNGKIIPKQNVNSSNKKNYIPKRFAQVNRTFQTAGGGNVSKTYLIPYDENVSNPIQNMGIQLTDEPEAIEEETQQTPKTQPKTLSLSEVKSKYKKELSGFTDQQIIDTYKEQGITLTK